MYFGTHTRVLKSGPSKIHKETWDPKEIAALRKIKAAGLHTHPGFVSVDWEKGLLENEGTVSYTMECLHLAAKDTTNLEQIAALLQHSTKSPRIFVDILKSCGISEQLGDFLEKCLRAGFFLEDIHINNLGYRPDDPGNLVFFDPQLVSF